MQCRGAYSFNPLLGLKDFIPVIFRVSRDGEEGGLNFLVNFYRKGIVFI